MLKYEAKILLPALNPCRHAKEGVHQQHGWANTAYGTSKIGVILLTKFQQAEIDKDTSRQDIVINSVRNVNNFYCMLKLRCAKIFALLECQCKKSKDSIIVKFFVNFSAVQAMLLHP